MQGTLTKPWGTHPAGTVIVDMGEDCESGVVRVTATRFLRLHEEGYLASEPVERELQARDDRLMNGEATQDTEIVGIFSDRQHWGEPIDKPREYLDRELGSSEKEK